MAIVVTLVVFGLVLALVTWRRRATARWRPDPVLAVGARDRGVPWCTRVWVQKEVPRRSMRRANDRVTGQLCVDATARAATFRVPDGQAVQLTNVRSVSVGSSGSDFVNTWVEVRCDVNGQSMVVYLNDARWLGWRPILTGANARLAGLIGDRPNFVDGFLGAGGEDRFFDTHRDPAKYGYRHLNERGYARLGLLVARRLLHDGALSPASVR